MCPGLKVVAPYSAADAKGLLKAAIRDPNPVIFLENEILYGQSFEVPDSDDWTVPIGKAKIVRAGQRRHHRRLLDHGRQGAGGGRALAAEGIDAEVIDLRTIRPLDVETIVASVQKTNRMVTVRGGLARCRHRLRDRRA